jgi:phosphatidylcholine synthase
MRWMGEGPISSRLRLQILGWCVHFYTALGLVAAAGIAVLLMEGGADAYRRIFLLMLAATLVDATDGTFARWVRVKEVLPGFDGRRLDDLVDFLTYTCLPLLLIWRAPLLPPGCEVVLLLPLLASAYGFCQTSVKTDDGYFLGFPSYWNLVAFYLYVLQPLAAWFSIGLLVLFSLLTFVPSRYLYPTQRGRLNRFTNWLGLSWSLLLVCIIWKMPDESARHLALLSLFFPAWYLSASWIISVQLWRRKRRRARTDSVSCKGVSTLGVERHPVLDVEPGVG